MKPFGSIKGKQNLSAISGASGMWHIEQHHSLRQGNSWPSRTEFLSDGVDGDLTVAVSTTFNITTTASGSRSVAVHSGAAEPPIRGLYDPLDGRCTTPSMGAARPPEQVVSRSEAVGILHTGANARSADAARAGAGRKPIHRQKLSTPIRL